MINRVTLIGRLGKDPVVKHFSNDSAIAEFPLATTESYKDKEGKWVEITDWHNIKLPNKYMAETAEKHYTKGLLIYVEGKLKTRSYDDKDGVKRYVTEVVAEKVRMLEKKEAANGGTKQAPVNTNTPTTDYSHNDPGDDDLPF